ncbi:aldo/keto reductase [Hyaloraphidium curvatum]|nr:aldo/keto reductase [Hyaloraphidium curvatum]
MSTNGNALGLAVPLGVGTMMWGDTPLDARIAGILDASVLDSLVAEATAANITLFDTAEGYGGGTSEKRLGDAVARASKVPAASLLLSTKFLPTLWRWTPWAVARAARGSCERLGIKQCPLYFIHSPVHPMPVEVWIRGVSLAVEEGTVRDLGLSNFNARQVERAVAEAKRLGNVRIAANQLMCNLLVSNSPELKETIRVCREHGIAVVAYSPLGQGLLCDGLTEEKAANTRLLTMTGLTYPDLANLRGVVAEIAAAHGKKMAHVALRYLIQQGHVPLVGMRRIEHLREALGAVGWELTADEMARLDAAALGRHTFEKPRWRRSLFVVFISLLMVAYKASSLWAAARERLSWSYWFPAKADKKER